MSFAVSENQRKLFQETFGIETKTIGKICDFCNKKLPLEFVSTQCSQCVTIFDECDECKSWPRPDPTRCHKKHLFNDNSTFSKQEEEAFQSAEGQLLLSMYGESWAQRMNNAFSLSADFFGDKLPPLILKDAEEFRKRGLTNVANMIEDGYKFVFEANPDHSGFLLKVYDKKLTKATK